MPNYLVSKRSKGPDGKPCQVLVGVLAIRPDGEGLLRTRLPLEKGGFTVELLVDEDEPTKAESRRPDEPSSQRTIPNRPRRLMPIPKVNGGKVRLAR